MRREHTRARTHGYTPWRVILFLGLALFGGEVFGSWLASALFDEHTAHSMVIHGSVLIAIAAPFIYFLLFKPYVTASRAAMAMEREYTSIVRTSMDGYWLVGPEGNLLDVNEAYCEISGYAREELIGMRIPDLEASESAEETAAHIVKIMNEGHDRFESVHRRKDGTTFDVEISVNYLSHGRGVMFAFLRDITMRKQIERDLSASRAGLEESQRIARLGSWEWDIARGTLWCSDEIYRIFGLEPESVEATCEGFLDHVHPDDRARVQEAMDCSLKGGGDYEIEHRIVLMDGTEKFVVERGEAVFEHGQAIRMLGTVQDITAHKKAEGVLTRKNALLKAIQDVQAVVLGDSGEGRGIFTSVLEALMEVTESPYGVICEAPEAGKGGTGMMVMAMHSREEPEAGERNHCTYFCNALVEGVAGAGRAVILNDLSKTKATERALPGCPDVEAFLGLPVRLGGRVTAVIALCNRAGGYADEMLEYLDPLTVAVGGVLAAHHLSEEREAALRAMEQSSADLASAQRIAQMGSWYWDVEANDQRWSDELYRILGTTPEETRAGYAALLNAVHPDDRHLVMKAMSAALDDKEPYRIEHRIVRADGTERMVEQEGEVVFGTRGVAERMMGAVQDVTERKQAEAERRMLSTAIEQSINVVYITDAEGDIEYVNPMFERLTGYTSKEAIGQTLRLLVSGEVAGHTWQGLWDTVRAGRTWRGTLRNRRKDGNPFWTSGIFTPIMDADGGVESVISIQEDITERLMAEERVKYLSDHDSVTGLLNRDRFVESMERALVEMGDDMSALLVVDLDGFKFINDRYGHRKGDEFLVAVSDRIREVLMSDENFGGGTMGRIGEDEFGLYMQPCSEVQALDMAERLRRSLELLRVDTMHLTACVGVVVSPDHGTRSIELMARADAAVYRAKELGRNRVYFYSPDDRFIEMIETAQHQKERLSVAIDEERIVAWYQPILDIRRDAVHHYEALARIRNKDGTILPPSEFIPVAERSGLIGSIDRAVMRMTCKQQARMMAEGRHMHFAMNISGKSLGSEEMLDDIKRIIDETGATPSYLIFEITETEAIGDMEKAVRFISSLRNLGCSFALDDFGVGFTSFVYLRELGLDYIKIDGSFIRYLHKRPEDQKLVRAMVEMAHSLGIRTIGEFVEEAPTLKLLEEMGVDFAQGYLIGKPSTDLLPS
jgi:diguanylate cyclase (GGDEF)-like protein/PAS domain S-box-containing protein